MLFAAVLVACQSSDPHGRRPKDDVTTDAPTDAGSDTGDTAVQPGEPVTESFGYSPPPADVLFVIDSSTSMTGRIAELTGALAPLVDAWLARSIDFHAGVVDIDDSGVQGRLIGLGGFRWVEPTAPDPGLNLQQLVESVGDPSTQEAGLAASYKALQLTDAGEYNDGFLRDGSELAVIVATDEADQSDPDLVTPPEYVAWLLGLRADPALVAFHALAATEDYLQVSDATGGVAWSVTNTPYGPALEAITRTIEGDNTFVLSRDAEEATITARVIEPDGAEADLGAADLDYDGSTRAVDLEAYYPAAGATVQITYVPLPD